MRLAAEKRNICGCDQNVRVVPGELTHYYKEPAQAQGSPTVSRVKGSLMQERSLSGAKTHEGMNLQTCKLSKTGAPASIPKDQDRDFPHGA